jgi:hypothetical protein
MSGIPARHFRLPQLVSANMKYLSHYTTRAGLEGIARSQTLWGTNFLDLTDTSEFLYAWRVLMLDAAKCALKNVPAELKRPDYDMDAEALRLGDSYRDMLKAGDGYDSLYVTSFARAANEDQEQRGILTLWRHYNGHEGYCLQFTQEDLEHMFQLDSWRSNYASLGFAQVRYGVNKATRCYEELLHQVTQNMTVQMLRAQPDLPIEPKWQGMWADSYLARRILDFCATHKDPLFEDEREVRLFGYPLAQAESRIFLGVAGRKKIQGRPGGKRYVEFGENWGPGISPRRIIIGVKADKAIDSIIEQFPIRPQVLHADLPIAQ